MTATTDSICLKSPAKVNLMLSVHGKREDGFHGLSSVVVALDFGDKLTIQCSDAEVDELTCDDPDVPLGVENLILQAATVFRERIGQTATFKFDLEKHIPMGAGLGGGSSNAAVALLGMNQLLDEPLARADLMELAAKVGSDCPFFIDSVPAVMRGRGEIIEPLDEATASRLRGLPIVLFRPEFGIGTAWAYGQLAKGNPGSYEPEAAGLARVESYQQSGSVADLLFNSFEAAVGEKYLAIPTLLEALRGAGFNVLMSGSGSCCFALDPQNINKLSDILRADWGKDVFWVESRIS